MSIKEKSPFESFCYHANNGPGVFLTVVVILIALVIMTYFVSDAFIQTATYNGMTPEHKLQLATAKIESETFKSAMDKINSMIRQTYLDNQAQEKLIHECIELTQEYNKTRLAISETRK